MPELAGRRQVRADAEVEPVALAVDRDLLALRQRLDMLGLVLLPDRGEVADRLFAVPHLAADRLVAVADLVRSEEHTSELQSLMRISSAVFCLKKKHI